MNYFFIEHYIYAIFVILVERRETIFETIDSSDIKYFYFNYCYARIDNFFFHFSSRFL